MRKVEGVGRSRVRRATAGLFGVVVLTLAVPVSPAASAEPQKLRDGFVVAAGSKLVGPVFPRIGFRGWSGWTAVVDVVGDAGPVFDEYVGQARRHGLDVGYSDQSCREVVPGDVTCNGASIVPDTQFELTLRVCTSCSTPIATATVQLLSAFPTPTFSEPLPADPPEPNFEVRLDAEMRQRRERALPVTGTTIPYLSELHQGPEPIAPLLVAPGAQAVATSKSSCLELDGMTAVLRSTRNVATVFEQYRSQVRHQANNGAPTSVRRTVHDAEVGSVDGSYANVSIVGAGGATWILANECFND